MMSDYDVPIHNTIVIPEGASKPCNYCISNPNNIGRAEEWWNAPYNAESEVENES